MTLTPHTAKDLLLAPVAAAIDLNLQRLRERDQSEVVLQLGLELDRPPFEDDRAERAQRVLLFAIRNVDLHHWDAAITDDGSAVHLSGGSVSLDISIGAAATRYVQEPETTAV